MTDLSPAAQAIDLAIAARIQLLGEIAPSRPIVATALRAAACQLTSAKAMDTLRAIANELDPPTS